MRMAFVLLLAVHGLIHMLGFAKGLELAEVPELQESVTRTQGLLWLLAGLLFMGGGVLLIVEPRFWWIPVAAALVVSQLLIFAAWSDARVGTIANAIILIPLVLAIADLRPASLRSQYEDAVERTLAATAPSDDVIRESDLDRLPPLVAAYARQVGVVGTPRVEGFHAVFDARIRQGPDADWMIGTAEQYEFFDPPVRLFFMKAWRRGLPADVFHRYADSGASIRARVLGLFTVMDVAGPELTQSETVTLLNDMVLLAPGALVDAPIEWETLDESRVRATYRNAGHTVSAVIHFDADGAVDDFESGDRYRLDGDARGLQRWSTPTHRYHDFGRVHLAAGGEARWGPPGDEWTYADFWLERITFDPWSGP